MNMTQAKQDCTQWLQDELMNHLQSGRFTPEQISEAVREMHDRLCGPEESHAIEKESPMTQEELDAIWANYGKPVTDDEECDQALDEYHDEITTHGGETIWVNSDVSAQEIAEMFADMLQDLGCVVLNDPADEERYVIFWPHQMPRTDTSHDGNEAPAILPITGTSGTVTAQPSSN
jgi:hypothetical protein